MKNIIFIAPPAAGKGTQSNLVSEKYHIPHISTGDILREVMKEDSEIGEYVLETISSGGLVKDDIMYTLLEKRLHEKDCQNGYILDGFPRNVEQAKKYDEILKRLGQELGYVISLEIDEKLLAKRITGRRVCEDCGAIYNINVPSELPEIESTCDLCGGNLYQRNDDNLESFQNRYQVYLEKTGPLLEYYKNKHILYQIDGNLSIEEVFKRITMILEGHYDND